MSLPFFSGNERLLSEITPTITNIRTKQKASNPVDIKIQKVTNLQQLNRTYSLGINWNASFRQF